MKEFHNSDELISTLNDFIKLNEKKLKAGSVCLTLNSICLEQLNLYLHGKRVSFKVSKSELLDLQFIISLIKFLRIDPNQPELVEKNRILDLTLFESIRVLELHYVKPGLISNLFKLSQHIEQFTVYGSLNSLDELLIVEDESSLPHFQSISTMIFELEDGTPLSPSELSNKRFQYLYNKNEIWSNLKELDISFNNIPEIDKSAYSLYKIEKLSLEGNLISRIGSNLQECLYLRVLNLSFNRIKEMNNINQELGMITHLSLRGNQIEHIESLNKLYALECLDISKNQIKDIQEIFKLNSLPQLEYLFTDENPFCDLKDYRNLIISNFLNNDNSINLLHSFYLDGKKVNEYEIEYIKKHTVDNGGFKTYQSPAVNKLSSTANSGMKTPSKSTTPTNGSALSSPQSSQKYSKDMYVPVVTDFAPNAKIESTMMLNNGGNSKGTRNHKHHHPNFNHTKSIEPIIDDSLPEDSQLYDEKGEIVENKQINNDLQFEEEKNLKKKIDELRLEGGNSWLLVLNEMSTFKENNHPIIEPQQTITTHSLTPLSSPMKKLKSPIKKSKKYGINSNINSNSNSNNNTPITTTTTTPISTTPNIPIIENTNTSTSTSQPISISNSPKEKTPSTSLSTTPTTTTTTTLSSTPTNNTIKSSLINNNSSNLNELICEPFSITKGNQNLLLQIKMDMIMETNLFGHSVHSYLLKNIVFVFSVPDAADANTVEIVIATNFKDGVPISFQREYYQMEDQRSLHQLLTVLVPPLYREYTMSCMDCSERYICKSEQNFTNCTKCNSRYLFFVPTTTDHSIMVVESPSTSFSNSLSLKDMTTFIEYNDDEFNNRIFSDQNIQLFFKMKIFKGGSKEVYTYIMKSNYIKYNSTAQEDEKQIYLLLSSTTFYLLTRKEKKSGDDSQFSVVTQFPLSEIRRVSVGLSSQLFRIELDDQCWVFIKRSQECTEKFLRLLFITTKQLSLPLEPYSRAIETRQIINALLQQPNEEFIKYTMLHHKVSGRNVVPKSLIISNQHLYLVVENFNQYPLLSKNIKPSSNQFTIFKFFAITDIIHLKYSKFKPNYFTISFEVEGNNSVIDWNLVTGNSVECDTCVSTISKLWKDNFHTNLQIIDN